MTTEPNDKQANDRYLSTVGQRVRNFRARRGMTRKQLACDAGISDRYLAQLELGRGNISIGLLRRITDTLGIDPGEILRLADGASAEQVLIADLLHELSEDEQRSALQLLYEHFRPPRSTHRRIAFIGLRGAGKTTLGRQLAGRLSLPFIHLVEEVERLGGMSVSEIFSLSGQAGYRRLEEKALTETLGSREACIIEVGGSIVADTKLYNLLLSACFVVWIRARPADHMQRVIDQGDLRPITDHDDAMADLRRILRQREPFYAQAHAVLDTSVRDIDGCLDKLVEMIPSNITTPDNR